MELRSQTQHRLVGGSRHMIASLTLLVFINPLWAETAENPEPVQRGIESARATISDAEKQRREVLSHLFTLNQKIKDMAKRRTQLTNKMLAQEGTVRGLAQEVQNLEQKSERSKENLNQRLRRLYQGRRQTNFQQVFSAQSPIELEKNHRFLKLMIDSDHKNLKTYLGDLKELRGKRDQLKSKVAQLMVLQKEVAGQETLLAREQKEKSRLIAEIQKTTAMTLSQLEGLRRTQGADSADNYAFFERKGSLQAPIEGKVSREFGTYVDPQFRFRLMHKGIFYSASAKTTVKAVFPGKVALAETLPGLGRAVILDHGDNYYSVYAFTSKLMVRAGARVKEGESLALSGSDSPLFGPGLYFEIRHFTEAIDPRHWIKEPVIKAANTF